MFDEFEAEVDVKIKEKYEKLPNLNKKRSIEDGICSRSEVSMWRAVIMQAIIDCYTLSKRTEDQIARKDAVSWFSLINKEFIKVCSYADLEPDYVMKKAKQAMQKSCSWRKDIHKEKRLSEINKDEFEAEVIYLNPNLFKKLLYNTYLYLLI